MDFGRKIEATLVEMRKLVARPQPEPIRLPLPSPRGTPQKTRLIVELKTLLPQHPGKEPVIEIPTMVILVAPVPMKTKMTERELETPKTTSFDPSPQNCTRKKKEPSPKPSTEIEEEGSSEEVEELELASSSEEPKSEEEAELAIPAPEKKKKIKPRISVRKKSTPVFKTPVSLKRPTKTPKKGESSQKKLRKK